MGSSKEVILKHIRKLHYSTLLKIPGYYSEVSGTKANTMLRSDETYSFRKSHPANKYLPNTYLARP